MTELEKAKQLKTLFIEHKNLFETGLCRFVTELTNKEILSYKESFDLTLCISSHSPNITRCKFKTTVRYSFWRKRNINSLYHFKCGDYERRLRWLNEIIKYHESND